MIFILIIAFVFIGLSEEDHTCDLSTRYYTSGVYPIATHLKSHYICDNTSVLKELEYEYTGLTNLGCNGINVFAGDSHLDITYRFDSLKDRIILVNYTVLHIFKSGNYMIEECGTVASGHCNGDHMWSTGYYKADDQNGCFDQGVKSMKATERHIQIDGRCHTKCTLGSSHLQIVNSADALKHTDY